MSITLRTKLYISALGVLIVVGMVTAGYLLHTKRVFELSSVAPPAQYPWALRVAKVTKRDLTSGFPVLATLNSRAEIVITPQITGVIDKIVLREGMAVKKGQLLVELNTQELANSLDSLKATLASAEEEARFQKQELERKQKLLKKGFTTQENVDRLVMTVRTADQRTNQIRNQIEGLKTRIAYGTINSPVDGIVAARLQESGDLATPGNPIYRITSESGAKIKISVPQNVMERIHLGTPIELQHGSIGKTVVVTRIFPALDALSMGSVEADIETIPFGLPSGAKVPGRVILERKIGALVVPITAVVFSPDGKTGLLFKIVSTADAGTSTLRKVKVKITGRGLEGVSVNDAVAEGDLVVIAQENALLKLRNGDPVLPEPERKVMN